MALSPTLQIRHMIESRSSSGISIAYLSVLVVGFALWFAYGVALDNLALMIPNTIAFIVLQEPLCVRVESGAHRGGERNSGRILNETPREARTSLCHVKPALC